MADRSVNPSIPSLARQACVIVAAALFLTLAFVTALLLARRAGGALDRPLSSGALIAVAVCMAGLAASVRWFAAAGGRRWEEWAASPIALFTLTAPAILLACLAASLSLPGASTFGIALLWGILIAEEAFWFATWRSRPLDRSAASPSAEATSFGPDMTQRLERALVNGAETIHGFARAPLLAGQRTAACHVAFCPPLERAPQVQFAQIEGPEARVKIGQLLAYGVRWDLKLAEAAESDCSVVLEFTARASG